MPWLEHVPLRAAPCPMQRVSSVSRVLLPSLPFEPQRCCGLSLPRRISPLASSSSRLPSPGLPGPWSPPGTLSGVLPPSFHHLSLAVVARGCLAWPQFPHVQIETRMIAPSSVIPLVPSGARENLAHRMDPSRPLSLTCNLGPRFYFLFPQI